MKNPKVALFFTAYNEELIIEHLIKKVPPGYDIFIVDDGSTDRTSEIAKTFGAKVLKHAVNIGQGNAVITMFKYLVISDYKYAVVMDADGQHDPVEAANFVNILIESDFDVVQGSRVLGKDYIRPPFLRKVFLRPLTKLLNFITGYKLTDAMCGYRAYRVETLKEYDFLFETFKEPEYMVSEVWIKFSKLGIKVVEIPIKMSERKYGMSYKGLWRYGWGVFLTIIKAKIDTQKDLFRKVGEVKK